MRTNSKYGWPGQSDCFAFDKAVGKPICGALNTPLCAVEGHCPFFSTRVKAEADKKRTRLQAIKAGYYLAGDKYEPRAQG